MRSIVSVHKVRQPAATAHVNTHINTIMDIQAGYRTFDIELSDGSSIEVEVGFKYSTGDEESIANNLLNECVLSDTLNPMESIVRVMLSEDKDTDDKETEDDEEELELEEGDERE